MPRPIEGVDMRRLPIGPEEAFVLSRVDGHTGEADIAAATGLSRDRVHESLEKLLELGAIAIEAAEETPPPPREHQPPHSRLEHPAIEAPADQRDHYHPAAALYDPAELDEDVDLDLPRKRRILDLFYRLDSVNHYELLEVPRNAEKKAIKDAYYEVVTIFHPDRYFGKNVGSFKPKLEKIFNRLTEAHDALTRKRSREEYDRYLSTQSKNQVLEQMMSAEQSQQQLAQVRRAIEEQARMAERASHSVPPPSGHPQPSRSASPAPRTDPEARRRALARKLGRSSLRGSSGPPPRSAAAGSPDRSVLKEELKRRYEERLASIKGEQIRRYIEAAERSLHDDNPVSAANALRIAVSLDPDDQDLAARLDAVQARANAELAQSYLEQAQYEERSGRFSEASQSYERAARGKPNARLLERAAHCLLEARGDVRKAGELAREAVGMAPDQAGVRTTLARVYLAANMKQSALAEFERAIQLAPGDESIKNWIKRVKRGEA